MHCSQDLLWSCRILHVNHVYSGDKPINHFILMGPCYHLGDYYILLTLNRHNFLPMVVYSPYTHTAHSIVVVLVQVR